MSVPAPTTVGRYHLHERLGQGTTGVVYTARDPAHDRLVAVKMMLPDVALDSKSRQHFLREARAVARLTHRHIAAVYEVAADGDSPFFAMELLRGVTLRSRLTTIPALTLAEGLEIVDQLCVGLQFAHEHGLVHRNVSPANIWLLDEGSVKLLDFGLPPTAAGTMTDRRTLVGRVAYMSPEQVAAKAVDGRADIFSAGVVLFELVTGRRPFEADSVTGIFDKVVNEAPAPLTGLPVRVATPLQAILARALDKDPARRYPDPLEMAADLTLVRLALVDAAETGTDPETVPVPIPPRREAPALLAIDVVRRPSHEPESFVPPEVFRQPPSTGPLDASAEPALMAAPLRQPPAVEEWVGARAASLPGIAGGNLTKWLGGGVAVVLAIFVGVWLARRSQPTTPQSSSAPHVAIKPAPGQVADVRIDSDPLDAELFLNGAALGVRTPATLAADKLRGAEIRAEKAGFESKSVRVSADDLASRRLSIRLTPELVPIVVSGSASFPFEVVNGRGVVSPRATVHRFTIRGEQTLRLRAPEYFLDRPVTVTGRTGTATLNVPPLGRLSVRTTPALERCRVSIAGRDFGTPPYPPIQYQPIVAGTHRVQLTCPDGSVKLEPVIVEASRDRSIVFR